MADAKPVNVPRGGHFKLSEAQTPMIEDEKAFMSKVLYGSAVSSLMYTMVRMRLDIAQAVGVVSRYISNPGKEHWRVVKWILRYLKGSSDIALYYGGMDLQLLGYVYSDFACDVDSRMSTTG